VEKVLFNGQRAAFDLVLGLDFLRRNFAVLDCGRHRLFTRPRRCRIKSKAISKRAAPRRLP